MRAKKQDMRYQRTQRFLKAALIELLQEKRIDKISVRELAERAEINRATFYLHYDSPYALLMALENQLFNTIMESYKENVMKNPDSFFVALYQCIEENYELSKILMQPHTAGDFWEKLSDELQICYLDNFIDLSSAAPYDEKELAYYCAFVKDGYLSIVKLWILNGMQEPIEEMVAISMRFLSHIRISEFLGAEKNK